MNVKFVSPKGEIFDAVDVRLSCPECGAIFKTADFSLINTDETRFSQSSDTEYTKCPVCGKVIDEPFAYLGWAT